MFTRHVLNARLKPTSGGDVLDKMGHHLYVDAADAAVFAVDAAARTRAEPVPTPKALPRVIDLTKIDDGPVGAEHGEPDWARDDAPGWETVF